MTTIFMIRHGDYENKSQLIPFRMKGFPLSQTGIIQIEKIAGILKKENIQAVYSSPILRAKLSASIISRKLGVPLKISQLLTESRSPFQGKSLTEFEKETRNLDTFKHPFHLENNGETVEEIYKRMKKLVGRLTRLYQKNSVALVSHGDPIMIYYLMHQGINIYETKNLPHYVQKGEMLKIQI